MFIARSVARPWHYQWCYLPQLTNYELPSCKLFSKRMLIQEFLMASSWARSLPVSLIPNSIHEVLPHLNHLLTRSRGKPPAKGSSMQINRLCGGCPIAAFWFAAYSTFPRSHASAFFLAALHKKYYKTLLCKMHSLHIKNCGKSLWPWHPEAMSRCCPAFPLPSESISSVTGKPSCSRPTNFFLEEMLFLFWAHCCRCKVCKGY